MTIVIKPRVRRSTRIRGRNQGVPSRTALVRAYVRTYLGYDIGGLISTWKKLFLHTRKHEGLLNAVKKGKDWYTLCLRKAGNLTFDPLPFTKSDKAGFPDALRAFKSYLEGKSFNGRRAALTVLQLYKLYEPKGRYSLKSITAPSTGEDSPVFIARYKRVLKKMFPPSQVQRRIEQLRPDFHISGRNGPNGPMLGTAFVDREAIRNTEIEHHVRRLCRLTYDYRLLGILDQSRIAREVKHNNGHLPCHSRIRIKYESGGKCRPFAIVDFFSQSALKPLHEFLMNWLKGQKCDGSDSHADAANAVNAWTGSGIPTWSFDLTSATDRWPVHLIHLAMEAAFGQEIADAWRSVITDRTFEGPSGEKVRWAVGQPLGALSSWAAFAVSHHAFIRTCYSLSRSLPRGGKELNPTQASWRPEQYYRMIGDDITIAHLDKVAQLYEFYLGKFGVEISISKSVVPQQCKYPAAELAKRLFVSGQEVTPVPPEAIITYSRPEGTRALLEASLMRGYLNAGSPYPVQSTLRSLEEWRLVTFPFRNALPQLNGVKTLFPEWKDRKSSPPAGLNENWFWWYDVPSENLQVFIQDYILNEVHKAEIETYQLIRQLSFTRGKVNPLERSLPQGGDWKPGLAQCHPQIVLTVLQSVAGKLRELSESVGDPNLLNEDLYRYIGRFHLFLEPHLLVNGRKSLDQKSMTRVIVSKIVRHCLKCIKDPSSLFPLQILGL